MDIKELNSKWKNLSEKNEIKGYKALRISPDCIPDLFIGLNQEGKRCLILFLPEQSDIRFKGSEKENLTLEFHMEKNIIVIKLNDQNFFDLFNELLLSLYNRISNITTPQVYTQELIQTFYKWSEFFDDKKNSFLSNEEIKGLYGELLVLLGFLEETDSFKINSILRAWKGPYNKSNDFEFEEKNIEVKTKEVTKPDIKISSEYQLEQEFGKGLELIVVLVENDIVNGASISDLIIMIRNVIRRKYGEISIFLKAINQKGLSFKNATQYNNTRFKVLRQITYNCESDEFPKLIRSLLPDQIRNVRYNIRINTLESFIISQKIF